MTGKAGVWIDHRRAVVVSLAADGEHVATIASNAEKHAERGGDSPLKGKYEAHQVPADDSRQRAYTGELNHYYDAVIAAVRDFQQVLLFGPGEAKGELHKRLIHARLGALVTAVETDDKMTEPQIVAKVRDHYGMQSPRR